jgi:hypothetical protein
MFTISSPAHTRSIFNIIIPYVLTYTKFVSSLEHFDKKYKWIPHFSEASYMPRKIHPCWLSHGVDILKKLKIMKSDIIQLSPVFISMLHQKHIFTLLRFRVADIVVGDSILFRHILVISQTHTAVHSIQINQPIRCNNFSSLLLDVYVQLNMFRSS